MMSTHLRRLLLGLGLALGTACTPAPNILPTNDLNRPTDITFMCLGAYGQPGTDANGAPIEVGPNEVTGQPMRICHPPAVNGDHQDQPIPTVHNRTFAFVPNSASGDLTVIDADNWKLVDLNKSTAGFGRVPLGSLPEQISSSTDGCRLMSANRGSCDLTLVDPSTLLAPTLAAQYNSPTVTVAEPPGHGLQDVRPLRGDGTFLRAAPYEAVFLPRNIAGLSGDANRCSQTTSWPALVTFPSCDLIALIDFPTGKIIASKKVVKTNDVIELVDAGTSPVCPVECKDDSAPPDGGMATDDAGTGNDAGATDDAGMPAPTPTPAAPGTYGPTGIAIFPNGTHGYVSLAKASAIASFALTSSTITPMSSVALQDATGSNRIRLGIDPWAIQPGNAGEEFVGKFISDPTRSQAYLYVIARDGSLRIVDVLSPGMEQECETNFDPLNPDVQASPLYTPANRCIPYDPSKRRPYSTDATTGLRFPNVPIDVAAADMTGDTKEDTVNGGYAWVLTSSGLIYLVNINPAARSIKAVVHQGQEQLFAPTAPSNPFPLSEDPYTYKNASDSSNVVAEPTPFPNRPRDRNVMSYAVSLDPALGPTRLDLPPLNLPTGPRIESIWTQGTEDNATALDVRPQKTYVFFPDRGAAIAQGWDVTWEGTITGPRYSGMLDGSVLNDNGGGFCSVGVLRGDLVTLRGCTTTADCPLGLVCDRDPSLDKVGGGLSVTGLCISANLQASLDSQCAPFKSSVRRYEIVEATENKLTLKPHLDEVVRSSVSPCQIPAGTAGTTGAAGATGTGGMGGTGGAAGMAGTDGMGTGGTGGAAGMAGTDGMGGGAGTVGMGGTGGAGGAGGTAGTGGTGGVDHKDDCHDPADPTTNAFACVAYKGNPNDPRCLMTCASNQDCRSGRVCMQMCKPGKNPDLSGCPAGAVDCTSDGMCVTAQDACHPSKSCNPGELCNPDGKCVFNSYCADGPPLTQNGCFPQLTSYTVNVNAGFLVTGSQAGSFSAGKTDGDGHCQPFESGSGPGQRDPRLVSRIPLRPYPGQTTSIECGPPEVVFTYPKYQTANPFDGVGPTPAGKSVNRSGDGFYIDHFAPSLEPLEKEVPGKLDNVSVEFTTTSMGMTTMTTLVARPEAPQLAEWMRTWTADKNVPNACLYMGGPIESETPDISPDPRTRPGRPQHVRARYRNTQVAFLLANIERGPAAGTNIHFDVHGGFRQQTVVMLSTVEVSAPARIVLGPFDSNRIDTITGKAAPFFFVVDQRRLGRGTGGGPTRGQIVRVNPYGLSTSNGFLPVYEDFHGSNGLFPIQ